MYDSYMFDLVTVEDNVRTTLGPITFFYSIVIRDARSSKPGQSTLVLGPEFCFRR